MFNKIVVLEPILITKEGKYELEKYSKEIVFYNSKPESENEIINRIDNADCILLSFTTKITKNILDKCPNIRYIGMSCSYYGEKYSNVDMKMAIEKGITIKIMEMTLFQNILYLN